MTLAEKMKIVDLSQGPKTTNGGLTTDYVSMKNYARATVVLSLTQSTGHATQILPKQATAVAGTSAKAFTNVLPIWHNENVATSDTLTRQTNAVSFTPAATATGMDVVFQIDADKLDMANGFDCLNFVLADSSVSANIASCVAYLEPRYPQANPPSAITD